MKTHSSTNGLGELINVVHEQANMQIIYRCVCRCRVCEIGIWGPHVSFLIWWFVLKYIPVCRVLVPWSNGNNHSVSPHPFPHSHHWVCTSTIYKAVLEHIDPLPYGTDFPAGDSSDNGTSLQWRHSECDGVSNHQPHDCLPERLFRRKSKKTSKPRVTGLCVGNSPGPVNSPHKWPVTRKCFHLTTSSWLCRISTNKCVYGWWLNNIAKPLSEPVLEYC